MAYPDKNHGIYGGQKDLNCIKNDRFYFGEFVKKLLGNYEKIFAYFFDSFIVLHL